MMRILQIIDNLKHYGGAQKLQLLFAEQMAHSAHELTILSLEADESSPIVPTLRSYGAQVDYLPGKSLVDLPRFLRLVRYVRRGRFDVAHTHLAFANILGAAAAYLAGTPAVATLHNERLQRRSYFAIKLALETFMLKRISREVIAVGYSAEAAHRARLAGKTIRVVPNAMELPHAMSAEERQELRAVLAGDPSRPIVITVGRLTQQKGYSDLLKAFSQVSRRFPQALLLIVGDGALCGELEAQKTALGLDGQVHLLGLRSDVPRLLAAADIYVNSSLWEGLSEALLEGMAAGLPVVATAVGDAPRVVMPEAGVLTPPGEPDRLAHELGILLADPQKARASGEAARQYVLHSHNPADWAEKIVEIYRSSVRSRRSLETQGGRA